MKGEVTIHAGGGSLHTGEAATRRFQLIALKHALELQKVGIRVRGRVSVLAKVKEMTGSRSNDIDKQIERLDLMIAELEKNITFKKEDGNG